MKTHDFYYDLPEELIAQTPVEPRDHSRMLVVHRAGGVLEHRHFYDITDYLNPGDVLVVNNTRVIPARLIGERAGGGAAEVLLQEGLTVMEAAMELGFSSSNYFAVVFRRHMGCSPREYLQRIRNG